MELSFANVANLCAGISPEDKSPVIDLSKYTFFMPFALVYLGQFLRFQNNKGIKFRFILPADTLASIYLNQQRFWFRFNCNLETTPRERLYFFNDTTKINDIIDVESRLDIAEEIANHVLRVLTYNSVYINHIVVVDIITELVDNFAQHADALLATLLIQYYPHRHEIALAVGDNGIGIRSSLCKNLKHEYLAVLPHYEAVLKAFEPMASRLEERGAGLTYVREQVLKAKGQIILATGDSYVKTNIDGTEMGNMAYNLTGTQIEVVLPEEERRI
ncbi:MAG: ATP-binding protein [Dehalococcoidales bacterium]